MRAPLQSSSSFTQTPPPHFRRSSFAFVVALATLVLQPGVLTAQSPFVVVGQDGSAAHLETLAGGSAWSPPLGESTLRDVAWGSTSALGAGDAGTAGELDKDGVRGSHPDLTPFDSGDVLSATWNGSDWLLTSSKGEVVRVDSDFDVGPARAVLNDTSVNAAAWNGTQWLVVGSNGEAQRVTAGGVPTGTIYQPTGGSGLFAAAAAGTGWVVGGHGGTVCFVAVSDEVGSCVASTFQVVTSILPIGNDWLIAGDTGSVQLLNEDGSIGDPIDVVEGWLNDLATNGADSVMAVGEYGQYRLLSLSGTPTATVGRALGGHPIQAVTWTGEAWLVVGGFGAVSLISPDGAVDEPEAPIALFSELTRGATVTWGGSSWLGASHFWTRQISSTGSLEGDEVTTDLTEDVDATPILIFRGPGWLLASSNGQFVLLDPTGMPVGEPATVFEGQTISAVSWNGREFLFGSTGAIRRADEHGELAVASISVFDGMAVEAAEWNGEEWLIAGCGAIQRVSAAGLPIGRLDAYEELLDGECIFDLAWNGTSALAVGEGGRVQLVSAFGAPESGVSSALAGATVRSVAWTGTQFIVVGDHGNAQYVSSSGSPLDEPINLLGWTRLTGVATAVLAEEGASCTDDRECASNRCVSDKCCVGCVVDGMCYQQGEQPEDDECNLCDPDTTETGWTPDVGATCDDETFCTRNDVCDATGVCVGTGETDCSDLDDQCSVGVCNVRIDACERDASIKNGDSCSDGVFCNGAEICGSGVCRPGTTPDCDHLTDACNVGICNTTSDECDVDSDELDGEDCDDGSYCNGTDHCNDGVCANDDEPIDCSSLDAECQRGSCDERAQDCVIAAVEVGHVCGDGVCSGRFADPPAICDIGGLCVRGTRTDCGESECTGGVCEFECDDDNQCPTAGFCRNGYCRPPNTPPTADPGPDQQVADQSEITLDGRRSFDFDGDEITYKWSQVSGPDVGSFTDDQAVTTFDAPEIGPGEQVTVEFELIVSDFASDSDPRTTVIDIQRFNGDRPPSAVITGPESGAPGELIVLDGRDSTSDDGELSHYWTPVEADLVALDDPSTEFITILVPDLPNGSERSYVLVVFDGNANSQPTTHTITISSGTTDDVGPDAEDESDMFPIGGDAGDLFSFDTAGYEPADDRADPPSDCACSVTVSSPSGFTIWLGLVLVGIARKKKGPRRSTRANL